MSAPHRSRVITEPLGGSALSLAVQNRRLPSDLQPSTPTTLDEWRGHADRARGANRGWFDALAPALAPTGAAATRLERSIGGRGIVITTGQQAGLFGGPLYNIAKALTALSLADLLEAELNVPVAPVFWAATDDSDFLEASVTYAADADGLHELTLPTRPAAGTPMSLAALGDVRPLLERLRTACGSSANPAYFDAVFAAYTNQTTIASAYVDLLRTLLTPLGIAVMDSSHPAYRAAARPVLTEALRHAPRIASDLAERAAAIRRLNFEPQVEDDRGLSLVYVIEAGIKRRVPVAEAATHAGDGKAVFAPNVLLRPIVERAILPTVAYVGGPAELAYFVQCGAVAEALGHALPTAVPRWSCTVVEPFAERALQRLGIDYSDVRDLSSLERRLASAAMPAGVAAAWKAVQDQMTTSVRALGAAVQRDALMPPPVIEGLERSLGHKLSRAERRLLAAVKRREARMRQDLSVVSAALFPKAQRQERMLNYIPMFARGGSALMDDMTQAARSHAGTIVNAQRREPAGAR